MRLSHAGIFVVRELEMNDKSIKTRVGEGIYKRELYNPIGQMIETCGVVLRVLLLKLNLLS